MVVAIPRLVPGDPIRVSATTYVAWKRCPDQANARLQGRYGPDTRPAFLGSLAHRIFSRHLRQGPIASDRFEQACREEIGASGLNNKMGPLEMRPSKLAGLIEEVHQLYQRFVKFPDEGFEGAEEELDVSVEGDLELVGTVDAVYREDLAGYRLVDWKTGDLGDPEDQLMFYALLWGLRRDDLPAYVEAVSVKTGERFRAVPSSADVGKVASEVADLVNQMRGAWHHGSELTRRAGPWCRYCPILDECSEGQAVTALLD